MRLTKTTNGAVTLDAAAFPDRSQETLNREISAFPPFREVVQRLAEHEDLEEAGRLVKLPCKVGDTVWCIENYGGKPIAMYSDVIQTIGISRNNIKIQPREHKSFGRFLIFGKTVFLTREEAEAALEGAK